MNLIDKIKDKALHKYIVSFTCKDPIKSSLLIGNRVKPLHVIAICNKVAMAKITHQVEVKYKGVTFDLLGGKVKNFKFLSLNKDNVKTIGDVASYFYACDI